jgi:hypothetical protein
VDEQAAQRLADETGRIVYRGLHEVLISGPFVRGGWVMTTDRDEAVAWGESQAFVPQRLRGRNEREQPRYDKQKNGWNRDWETDNVPDTFDPADAGE